MLRYKSPIINWNEMAGVWGTCLAWHVSWQADSLSFTKYVWWQEGCMCCSVALYSYWQSYNKLALKLESRFCIIYRLTIFDDTANWLVSWKFYFQSVGYILSLFSSGSTYRLDGEDAGKCMINFDHHAVVLETIPGVYSYPPSDLFIKLLRCSCIYYQVENESPAIPPKHERGEVFSTGLL